MEKVYDVLIIGGGPAGYTAALYSARAGLSTLTVEKMSPGGQMTLTGDIENYPGFDEGVDGYTLGMKMQAGAVKFGAETVYGEVTEVDLSEKIKRTKTTDGEYFSKTVIIATGAVARPLGLPDEEALTGRGVHYCAHCDGRFYRDKTVMVVGGGNSAAADALYLSRLCKKVYLVHRRDTLRAERVYHAPLMSAENVEFIWNSTAVGLISEKRVAGVRDRDLKTDTETEISVDGLFVSIGRKPETSLFKGQLALEGGYIVAGEDTKTSIPGVFAAGDVRTKTLRQIITAAADGAVAATEAERYITEEF